MEVHQRKRGRSFIWLGSLDDSAVVLLSHPLYFFLCVHVDTGVCGDVGPRARACVCAWNQFQDGKIKAAKYPLMPFSKTKSVKRHTKKCSTFFFFFLACYLHIRDHIRAYTDFKHGCPLGRGRWLNILNYLSMFMESYNNMKSNRDTYFKAIVSIRIRYM